MPFLPSVRGTYCLLFDSWPFQRQSLDKRSDKAALRGTGLPCPIVGDPSERCAGADDIPNAGERQVVGRDHHLLVRASIQECSAGPRAPIEIKSNPPRQSGVLESDSAVSNNVTVQRT